MNLVSVLKIVQGWVKIKGSGGTLIGNVGDALKVTSSPDPSDTPGCTTFSKKLRTDFSDSNITMGVSYSTIYSYSGSGKLSGFTLDFNSDDVRVKLTIDSTEVVFELVLSDIEDIQLSTGDEGTDYGICNGVLVVGSGSKIQFCPPCPIKYGSQVLIEGQRSDSDDHTMNRSIVVLTKES